MQKKRKIIYRHGAGEGKTMKLMMDLTGSTLSLRAESPADLEFLYVMQGVHAPGPWAHATFANLPYDLLGFEHLEAGKHYALRGQPQCVMAGVLLKLDWLTYAEPLSEKAKFTPLFPPLAGVFIA